MDGKYSLPENTCLHIVSPFGSHPTAREAMRSSAIPVGCLSEGLQEPCSDHYWCMPPRLSPTTTTWTTSPSESSPSFPSSSRSGLPRPSPCGEPPSPPAPRPGLSAFRRGRAGTRCAQVPVSCRVLAVTSTLPKLRPPCFSSPPDNGSPDPDPSRGPNAPVIRAPRGLPEGPKLKRNLTERGLQQ